MADKFFSSKNFVSETKNFVKLFFGWQKFGFKKYWARKNVGCKSFGKKHCLWKYFFGREIFWSKENLWINFEPKEIFGQIFLGQKNVRSNI